LGLTIVATIARAHHGAAEARNLPDGGADVSLRLPLRATMWLDDARAPVQTS
jgi:signal transduction histidine kinase